MAFRKATTATLGVLTGITLFPALVVGFLAAGLLAIAVLVGALAGAAPETVDPVSGRTASQAVERLDDRERYLDQLCGRMLGADAMRAGDECYTLGSDDLPGISVRLGS